MKPKLFFLETKDSNIYSEAINHYGLLATVGRTPHPQSNYKKNLANNLFFF